MELYATVRFPGFFFSHPLNTAVLVRHLTFGLSAEVSKTGPRGQNVYYKLTLDFYNTPN
jgi:hypothetical protein